MHGRALRWDGDWASGATADKGWDGHGEDEEEYRLRIVREMNARKQSANFTTSTDGSRQAKER